MIKKIILSIAAVAVAVAAVSAEELRRYELEVQDFNELIVVEGLRVDYKCNPDSAGFIRFVTTPDIASVLMFTNNKSRLEMQISTDGIDYDNLPLITVYSRFLSRVENSGDSLVRVLSLQPAPNLKVRLIGNGGLAVHGIDATNLDASLDTGNGTITLNGKATKAKYSLVGTGSIQADELDADWIKCSLLGTGFIGCSPRSALNIVGASSGKVYYKGTPKITNRSIGVKIVPLDENSVVTE